MRHRKLASTILLALTFGLAAAAQGSPLLTLTPVGGGLTGTPGQLVGWGFTFFNDTDWAVVTGADYVTLTPVGTFTDFMSPQFEPIGPLRPIWSQVFNSSLQTGAGSYLIDSGAVPGLSTGQIQVTYDLYGVDPLDPAFDPGLDLISAGNVASALASVEVVAPVLIPEPGLGAGVGLIVAVLIASKRKPS